MKSLAISIPIMLLINQFGTAVARSKNKKMPSEPIKLYYLGPSPHCRSVMLAARILDLELDMIPINIMTGDQMTPEYLKMNPQHTVPTIDDSGFILWESRAILAYLVNAYGKDDSLYPKNPRQRAIVDQRLNFDIGTLFPRYASLYFPILLRGEEFNQKKADKLNEALGWLNIFLEKRAFAAGDDLTIADIAMVVTFTNLSAFEYDFSAYENITKWFERTKKALEPYGWEEIDDIGAQILAEFMKSHKQ